MVGRGGETMPGGGGDFGDDADGAAGALCPDSRMPSGVKEHWLSSGCRRAQFYSNY